MSRIGKLPVAIAPGVQVELEQSRIRVKGPKGSLELDTRGHVGINLSDSEIRVSRPGEDKKSRAYHGLYQRLITNMVAGVTQGFQKDLEIQGVGYRAQLEGRALVCYLGYSHPVRYEPPSGISIQCPDPTHIAISGIDKQLVGLVAAKIRSFRKPEPYKGKGVRYVGEYVRKKVGKTGVK